MKYCKHNHSKGKEHNAGLEKVIFAQNALNKAKTEFDNVMLENDKEIKKTAAVEQLAQNP